MKSLSLPRARPLGFYLSGLANLKRHLDETDRERRLTQVRTRILVQRLANHKEFEDHYGTPGHVQLKAYLEILRDECPGVDEDLIIRMLPGAGRRAHRTTEHRTTLDVRS